MKGRVPRVADAELAVLKLLWEWQPLTAREMAESLYGSASVSNIGTVQKLLQRLEGKRLVRRDRRSYAHRFSATVTRSAYAGQQLEHMAESLTDGSITPFITHLVEARRLSKRERDEIRRLLDGPRSK